LKKFVTWLVLGVLILAVISSVSCSSSAKTTAAAGPTILTVTNGSKVKSYSMADLQTLKAVTGNGGTKNKMGTISGPFSYKGVSLIDLINAVGGVAAGQSVKFTGSDGYSKTLSYDQIMNGTFNTYDTAGNAVTPQTKPVLAVVYSSNGAALDSDTGPLEVGILYAQNYVSDGSNWVKLLIKIDIISAQ
jgi:DMSO/TMAO reductase YedYZ molybdopterin-dependent catalytic subunit